MANLVLNGEPINTIDEIDKIAANYVEADMLDAFRNGLLEEWLREQLEDDMADTIGKLKEGKNLANNIIKVLGLDKDECMASQRRIEAESAKAAEKARQKEASRTEADVHASTHKTRKRKTEETEEDASETETLDDTCPSVFIRDLISAANQDNVHAMKSLAERYRNGDGVRKSTREAARWQKKAEDAMKDTEPKKRRSRRSRKKEYNGSGAEALTEDAVSAEEFHTSENEEATIESLVGRANSGDVDAQIRLSEYYWHQEEFAEAKKWYSVAAEVGNSEAQNMLGLCYGEGKGVKRNYKRALKWYKLAAEQKHPWGAYNAGYLYYANYGLDYDEDDSDCINDDIRRLEKARLYFSRAVTWGCSDAREMLSKVRGELKELKSQVAAYNYNQIKREADPLYAAKQYWENDDPAGALVNLAKGIFRKLSTFG